MAKKTPESKEDAAARRQRELALLTSGVAAFSLMGEAPRPEAPVAAPAAAPAQAPTSAAPVGPAAADPAPAAAQPAPVATPPASPQPNTRKADAQPAAAPSKAAEAISQAKRVGEGPAAAATPAPTLSVAEEEVPDEADADPTPEPPVTPAESSELDLTQLFVPSAEKKGTTLRITADHQQFFTNLGFLLGNGASAPDIIHNILTRFRVDHEAQIQKAMKKQMRLLLAPKK